MTSLASREMTEQEMINTCTASQMAHLIQVLRQTIRNKDKEIEKWVDMVSQLQRDGELDPPAKPQYKVGDWVEFIDAGSHKSQGKYLSDAYENTILVLDTIYNMRCVVPTSKITRKLAPSEVIVKIGCLEGTVEKAQDFQLFLMWHSRRDCDYSMIKFSALDTPTRSLVESLLKAQGGAE